MQRLVSQFEGNLMTATVVTGIINNYCNFTIAGSGQ